VSSLATSATTTIAGIITGSGWLTLKSSGDMSGNGGGASGLGIKLGSADTFNGNVTITAGLVAYAGDSSFGNATNLIILNGGGLLDNNVSLALAHNIQVNSGGGTIRFYGTSSPTWSSAITGSGYINKTDGGSVTFSGDLSGYTGSFTNEGSGNVTLTGAAAASIGGNWNVTNSANSITVNSTANQSLGGVISGLGSLVKNGAGTLTLSGANTYTGATTISGGILALGGAGKLGAGTYAANITDNAAFVVNSSAAQTLSGIISGAGTLTQQGTGGLSLAGVNTYTGATTISGGALTIGGAGRLGSGSYAGLITNNAALVYNSSAAQTLSGVISGTGTLTQQGTGILTLTGVNSLTGAVTVSAGELITITGGSVGGGLTVANGATNSVQALATGGQWICGGLTYNAGTAYADFNFFGAAPSTTTAPVQVNGNLNINGTLNIIVRGGGFVVGNYPLIKYTGTLTGTPPTGAFILPNGMTATINNNTGNSSIDLDVTVGSQITWATGSGTWDINTTANWQNTSSNSVNYLDGNAVQFEDTLSGASPITVTLNTVVNPAAVTANDSSKNYTISGTGGISGSAGLIKNGTGTLTLSTSNSFTGPTLVTAGVLQFGTNTAFGSSAVVTNAGTLDLNGFDFTAPMFNRPIIISGTGVGGTVITNSATARGQLHDVVLGADATIASANTIFIGGTNAQNGTLNLNGHNLTLAGSGTVIVNGVNMTGAGNITVNSGTLQLMDNYGNNQQTTTLAGSGNLTINSGASLTTTRWSPTLTLSMPIVLNGGTISTVWPSPNGSTFACPITVNSNSTINLNGAGYGNATFSGNIMGAGGLTVTGDGSTRTFTGANSYGWTTIGAGTLQIGNGGTAGTLGLGPVTNNATLTFDLTSTSLVSSQISGTGALKDIATGAVTLFGTNTYSGATTVSAGELIGASGGSCSNSAVTLGTGTTNGVQLLAANGQWACSNLTVGSAFGDYCYGDFNFGGFAPSSSIAALLVNGNLAIKGFYNVIVRNATLVVGQYPLIQYTGTLSGTPPNLPLSIPAGTVAYIYNNLANKSLDLVVTATSYSTAIWAGGNGVWDINTTFSWTNASGSPITYQEGNAVVFNNPPSNSIVTLNSPVNPAALANGMAVNNTANYIVSGSGAIAGAAGLTKAGSGELTLATANTYSGGTTLSGGTIRASTTDSALGTGLLTVTASAKLATASGGGARTLVNPVVVSSGQTLALDAGYANLSLNGPIGGAGSLSATAGGTVTLGGTNTIASTLTLNSGSVVIPTGGATTNLGGGISVGLNGVLNIQSGATLSGLWLRTADGSGANNSIVNQNGGTVTLTTTDSSNGGGSTTRLGHWGTSGNVYNLNGGTLNCLNAVLNNGWDGASQITVNGGTANLYGLQMGALGHGGSNDTFILLSGTVKLGAFGITNNGAGVKTFNLGAGTVGSLAAWSSTNAMTLIDSNTGTTFDTTGGTISLSGPLTGIGSLNKSGANNLNLSGTNNYAGNTTINAGTLQVTNAGNLILLGNVSGAGTLAFGSGTTLNIGGPGNPTSLNVGTPLTLSGANLVYDLPDPNLSLPSDTIAMAGSPTLTLTGTTTVTPTGPLANGTYNLITGAGTITGTAANLALAASATSGIRGTPVAAFTVSSPNVTLAISGDTGAQPLTWLGTNGANWDLSTTLNWNNTGTSLVDKFYSLDNVTFDDTYPNSSNNVTLVGALYPTTVTIGSNTRNYNFGGSGSIAGAASLTMNGGSTLTISNANSFVGGTTINGGVLRLANGSALGNGPLTLGGGILDLNSNNLSVQTLSGVAGTIITNTYVTGTANTKTLTVNQYGSNTFAGLIKKSIGTTTNDIALVKNGPGYLTLGGVNTYTGGTTVNAGTLEVTNAKPNSYETAYTIAQGATLKYGYSTATTYYGNPLITIYGNGVNDPSGLYILGGKTIVINDGSPAIDIKNAPTTIKTYGSGTATINFGFAYSSAIYSEAAASGSVIASNINVSVSTSYGGVFQTDLGVNTASGDLTVNGVITGGTSAYANATVTKTGTGSLKLTTTNNFVYNGVSTFNLQSGSVILSGRGNLPATTVLTLGTGTTSGSLILGDSNGGVSQTIASLLTSGTGTANAVVGGSASPSILTITNAGAVAYTGNLGGPSVNQNNLALVKTGAGLLTLSGQLAYNGSTTINAGSVVASSLTVADGATLTLPDVAGTLAATNLVLGTSAGSTLAITSFAGAGSAPIVVTNLSTAGTVTVTLAGSLALGEYPLIKYSGTIGGAGIGAFQLVRGMSGTITNNLATSSVDVILTGTNIYPLVWKGNVSTNWDVSTTTNWAFNVLASTYKNGDNVQFDDTAVTSATNIALNVSVTPAGLTVSNNTNNYTISGNGALAGNIGLTKNGSASLTLLTTNTFTGATVINGGTVSIATITNGGVASSLGAANNNPTNIVLNGGTLAYTGLNTASDRGITLTTNNGTIAVIGGNNLTLNGAANNLTGSGSLTKNGNGTLTLSTLNNYTGTTVVNGGTLVSTVWEWYGRRGIGSGLLTINSGATVEFTQVHGFGVSIDGRAAVINGGTLQLDSGNYVLGFTMTGGLVDGAGLTVSGTGLTVTANAAATTAVISNNISAGTYSGTVGTTLIVSNGVAPVGLEIDGNLTDGGIALNLTKNGAGTALLTGANTYSGNTTINGGTLLLSGSAFSPNTPVITLANNSTLNVSNLASPLVLSGSQTLQGSGNVLGAVADSGSTTIIPGGTTNVGTLAFSSDLTLAGSDNLNFDLGKTPTSAGGTNNDQIMVAGNLTINPGTVININPIQLALAGGTYKLISYTGTLTDNSGGIATAWTTAGYTPSGRVTGIALSSATPGEIDLIVSGSPANLVWQGDGSANAWDVQNAPNWLNGITSDQFFQYDNVLFNDSSINTNVDIQAAVTPSSVVVSNNVNHYTFINDQGINGGTGLTKNGTGTLTILNSNPYTGVTTINQGTLEIGDGATVDGSLTASPIVDNATLKFNVVSGQSPATAISGLGTVVVQSPNNTSGTLTLDAVNSWTGGLNILSGIAKPGVNNALPVGESVTVASGGAYDFNGVNNGGSTTRAYSFTIAGAGPDTVSGALVNNGGSVASYASVSNLTLSANATIGGSGRWDIGPATNSTINGNSNTLTISPNANQIDLRAQYITNVANVQINGGNVWYESYSQTNSSTANMTNYLASAATLGIYGGQTINVPIVSQGGTIDNQGNGTETWSGPVDMEQPTTINTANGSIVFAGTVTTNLYGSTSGSINISGGNNTVAFAGNDTVPVADMNWTTGTVQLGNNTPSGSVPDASIYVPPAGTFSLNRSDLYTLTNVIYGDGNMSVLGTTGQVVNGSASINIGGNLSVGQGAYGKLLIQPGANITANGLFQGNPASSVGGEVVQTGGLLTTTNATTTGYFRIGHWATETSSYSMFGGTNIVDGILSVGWDGTGSLRQTNGLINVGLELEVPMSGHGGPGTYVLEGGSIIIGSSGIYCGGGSSAIYLGGGTVGASTNWSTTAAMTLTGTNGSTTFDTGVYTNTLGGALSGTGGLVKASSGTLVLSSGSAYTYAGDTIINGGTLTLSGAAVAGGVNKLASGTVWVNPGATLNLAAGAQFNYGSGTPAVVLNNGTLAMTDSQYNYIKNITFTNGATWALGTGSLINGLTGANFNLATVTSQASANTSTITTRGGAIAANGGVAFNVARGTTASDLIVSAILSDYNGGLGSITKTGNGVLTLNAANSYSGTTTISAGTLALGALGSIGYSTNIVIAGGATLDASANYFPLSSSQTLGNSGGTAILGGNVNATSGKVALAYASGTPALNVTNGVLTLAPASTIKVNNTGAPLTTAGSPYKLISKTTGGSVAGTVPASAVVGGNGLAVGTTNSLQIISGELYLNVTATVNSTPTNIVSTISGNTLTLSWPSDHTGWRLQVQTNSLNTGLGTNWVTWPYSDSTTNNSVSVTMNPNAPTVFFRMIYP
jgi:autotransporter-associated beta strand protein